MNINLNLKNIVLLSMLFFILLYLRRFDQLFHPDVWNEDGMYNIPSYIASGWGNLFEPVQGYLIMVSKLITDIAMSISFSYYPEISTWLTWLFTIVLSLIIVYAPTVIPYRIFAAIMIYMVPAYAEPYGIPLYTFWFAGLFIVLVLLWQENEQVWFKNILLIIGGLSSPIVLVALPAQIFRFIFLKNKKEETVTLLVMLTIGCIQVYTMLQTGAVGSGKHPLMAFNDGYDIDKYVAFFFGKYYLGAFFMEDYSLWLVNNYDLLLVGGIILICILLIYLLMHRRDPFIYIFIYLVCVMLLSVLYRTGFEYTHLSPRYFFYISIMISWTLLYLAYHSRAYSFFAVPILILSTVTALGIFSKKSDTLEWRKHIYACKNATTVYYKIPVHFAGSKLNTWSFPLEPKICRALLENDYFRLRESKCLK
jgi:hypothetical protein